MVFTTHSKSVPVSRFADDRNVWELEYPKEKHLSLVALPETVLCWMALINVSISQNSLYGLNVMLLYSKFPVLQPFFTFS